MNRRFAFGASLLAVVISGCHGTKPQTPPVSPTAAGATAAPTTVGDPPPVTDGDVTTGTVSGIQVIVKRVPGAEFAAGRLYIRGGARNWTANNAGIESIALGVAASGGTKKLDKTAFSRTLAGLGAQLGGDAGLDYSQMHCKAPRDRWDETFALLADTFLSPALPASEIELARQQSLASLHHELEDPDGRLWTLERNQVFAGHPYLSRAIGTLDTVTAMKAGDLAPYLDQLRVTSRLLFVAVGDVDPTHVLAQVKQAFGALPPGSYQDTPIPALHFDKAKLTTETRALPTNYVETAFGAPGWSEPDYVTSLVAYHALSARLWDEVRTKRNLTYAVQANIYQYAHPLGMLYVTATDPNTTMKVILDQVKRLQTEPVADIDLAGYKAVYLTGYLEGHETTDYIALSLGDAQLNGGDWRLARTFPDRVRAVTAADIKAFAQKNFVHMQTAVLGDPSKIDAALFQSL